MKLCFILVLIICFSAFTSRRIQKFHSKHRTQFLRQAGNNIMYRFLQGFIIALAGDTNIIEACSGKVPGWLQAGDRERKFGTSKNEMAGNTSTTFMTILGYLGKAVDFICIVKYKIMSFLNLRFRRRMRLFMQGKTKRRTNGFFFDDLWKGIEKAAVVVGNGIADAAVITGKGIAKAAVVTGNGIADAAVITGNGIADAAIITGKGIADAAVITGKGIAKAGTVVGEGIADAAVITGKGIAKAAVIVGEGIVDATLTITEGIEKIAKATANLSLKEIASGIVTGVFKITDLVVDGAKLLKKSVEYCLNFLKEKILLIFKPVWDLLDKIKMKILGYLIGSDLMKTLFPFAECFLGLHQVRQTIKMFKTLTSLTTLIPRLAAGVGWVELCLNLFCGWRQVQKAIEWLIKANDEHDPLVAYSHHGHFAGYLIEAVSGA